MGVCGVVWCGVVDDGGGVEVVYAVVMVESSRNGHECASSICSVLFRLVPGEECPYT